MARLATRFSGVPGRTPGSPHLPPPADQLFVRIFASCNSSSLSCTTTVARSVQYTALEGILALYAQDQ